MKARSLKTVMNKKNIKYAAAALAVMFSFSSCCWHHHCAANWHAPVQHRAVAVHHVDHHAPVHHRAHRHRR